MLFGRPDTIERDSLSGRGRLKDEFAGLVSAAHAATPAVLVKPLLRLLTN